MAQTPTPQVPMTEEKKTPWLMIIVIILGLIVVAGILYMLLRQPATPQTTATTTPSAVATATPTPAITSDADLQKSSTSLDNVNLDSMDADLAQNDTDAATF
jgi:flagellar basal body-associated protein FliL